jgi:ABC-type histidine transport system ATPase subunit
MTMVVATHEMSFARDVADRVVFIHDGVIVEQGPPAQVAIDGRTGCRSTWSFWPTMSGWIAM